MFKILLFFPLKDYLMIEQFVVKNSPPFIVLNPLNNSEKLKKKNFNYV